VLAVGRDRLELQPVRQTDLAVQRNAPRADLLLWIVQSALAVEHAVRCCDGGVARSDRAQVRDQAMPAARVAVVPGLIGRHPEENAVGWFEFDRSARRPNVLVVILRARREIVAKPLAGEPGDRRAD